MSRSRKKIAGGTWVICKSQKIGKKICHRKFRRRNVADCPDEYFFNPNYDRNSDYYTLENEHGETQADIDNLYRSIKDSPTNFFGKDFFVERHEKK